MKILLAVDGSEHSGVVINELLHRPWPANTELRVLSVAHPIPYIRDPFMVGLACHLDSEKWEDERASKVAAQVSDHIARAAPEFRLSTSVLRGSPKEQIVEEAERWHADLILVGSHGYGPLGRFVLGSVAASVAAHAPCSVEIVRTPNHKDSVLRAQVARSAIPVPATLLS